MDNNIIPKQENTSPEIENNSIKETLGWSAPASEVSSVDNNGGFPTEEVLVVTPKPEVETSSQLPESPTTELQEEHTEEPGEESETVVSFLQNFLHTDDYQLNFDEPVNEGMKKYILHLMPVRQSEIIKLANRLNPEHNDYDEKFMQDTFKNKTEEEIAMFYQNMATSINMVLAGDGLEKFVNDPNAEFATGVQYKDKIVRPQRVNSSLPAKKEDSSGESLNEVVAVAKFKIFTNQGEYIDIFLPHTGISVRLSIAGDDEHIHLNEIISKEVSVVGRKTTGAIFSNTSVLVERAVVDFILGRVKRASINTEDFKKLENLKKVILAPDIPFLLTAYAAGRYARGYPLGVICNIKDACNHEEVHNTDILKLIKFANGRLTENQRKHSYHAAGKPMKQGDIEYYQREHLWLNNNTRELSNGLVMEFKVPTIQEKETAGLDWVASLENMAAMALDTSYNGKQREEFIRSQAAASSLRQYMPWFSRIVYPDGDFAEGSALVDTLRELNADTELRDELFEKTNDFINSALVGLIGYPRWKCPNCNQLQPETNDIIPGIFPINPLHVFFTLLINGLRKNLAGADI